MNTASSLPLERLVSCDFFPPSELSLIPEFCLFTCCYTIYIHACKYVIFMVIILTTA